MVIAAQNKARFEGGEFPAVAGEHRLASLDDGLGQFQLFLEMGSRLHAERVDGLSEGLCF